MGNEPQESGIKLDGVSVRKENDQPERKTIARLENDKSVPQVEPDNSKDTNSKIPDLDNEQMTVEEVIEMYKIKFNKIKKIEVSLMVKEAKECVINIPLDRIDSAQLAYLMGKVNAYRNKIVQMQFVCKRDFNLKNRIYKSLYKLIMGTATGSSADRRQAEAEAQTVEFAEAAGNAQDVVEALEGILDNLDQTYNQISFIGKRLDSPTNSLIIQEGDSISKEDL